MSPIAKRIGATAAYYGMIEWVDMQYARVISRLEELNVLDDFVVVFYERSRRDVGTKGAVGEQQYSRHPRARRSSSRVRRELQFRLKDGVPFTRTSGSTECLASRSLPDSLRSCQCAQPEGLDGRSLVPLMEGTDGWLAK